MILGRKGKPTGRRASLRLVAALLAAGLAAGPIAGASARNAASSMTGLKLSADKPVKIDADRLEVHQKDNSATFTGHVSVSQDATVMKAGLLVVYYAKGSGGNPATGSARIDHIEATGKVYVRSDKQVATGDSATFDMKTQLLVMTGSKVVLTDGDNVAMGCRLTVQMRTGEAKLDGCKGGTGRVSIVVTPGSLPKAEAGSKGATGK